MRKFIFIFPLLLLCISCHNNKENSDEEEARALFSQSVNLILEFTSKIKIATDSMQVDSLSEIFEKKITDINFRFPSNTDFKLTEQENDSLFHLMEIYRKEKNIKYNSLSIQSCDSI